MDKIFISKRADDDLKDSRMIAVHIPEWVRWHLKNGDQLTAVLDDDSRVRWLINDREVTPVDGDCDDARSR